MDYKNTYRDFLRKFIQVKKPLTVVFDASNGPAGMIVKDLFAGTLVKAIVIHDDIDPDFKAHGPNPLMPGASDNCAKAIREHRADVGIMFDADGDRAFFLDDTGSMLPACFISALLFRASKPPYVVDELIYQSLKFLKTIPEEQVIPSKIGAYHIKEKMRGHGGSTGAEYSGHYFFKDFFTLDSGIFAAIIVLNTLSGMDEKLSVWKRSFGEHEIITKEIKIAGKDMPALYASLEEKYSRLADHTDKRDGLTFVFSDCWMNVRSSNTEPIMRIIAGGGGQMREWVSKIEASIL